MAIDNQLFYPYIDSITGLTYQISLSQSTGTILGITNENYGAHPPWPKKHKDLRHITGRDNTGLVRRRLTVTDPASTLFTANVTTTWTDKEGNTIVREGRFAGRFPQKG